MTTSELERISAFVPRDLHSMLVERAREEDRTISAELRQALREHLGPTKLDEENPQPMEAR